MKTMSFKPVSSKYVNKTTLRVQELNIEKDFIHLKHRINTALSEFCRKYDIVKERVVVVGKNELALIYKAYDLLDITDDFKIDEEFGFINSFWGMDIYTSGVDSFVGIFGKANNIIFVEDE